MDNVYLYNQIADSIRQDILSGQLKPGDRLPSMRKICRQWKCTLGTCQRAYRTLAKQGLVVSQSGRGTHVAHTIPPGLEAQRRAKLVHRAEAYLLEMLTSGYTLLEAQSAIDLAVDRWRIQTATPIPGETHRIRFAGSHDTIISVLASHFSDIFPGAELQVSFTGSLGGLMALAEGRADLAGCHLWDSESQEYNLPFVRRILPGKKVRVVTLAQRQVGLVLAAGNPHRIQGLVDLQRSGMRLANRQSGSGTRVWLDEALAQLGINPSQLNGYTNEFSTHSAVAQAIADDQADVGIALESAARAFGLDFIPQTKERYDLVALVQEHTQPDLGVFLSWLKTPAAHAFIGQYEGYDPRKCGQEIS